MQKTGHITDVTCELCGGEKHTISHVIWTCTALHHIRVAANPTLAALPIDTIPHPVGIGIAPAMCIFPCRPYSGDIADDDMQDLGENLDSFIGISDTITHARADGTTSKNKLSAAAAEEIDNLAALWGDARENAECRDIIASNYRLRLTCGLCLVREIGAPKI